MPLTYFIILRWDKMMKSEKRHGIKGGKITLQYLIVQRLQNERKPSFSTFITSTISNSYKQVRKRASFAL